MDRDRFELFASVDTAHYMKEYIRQHFGELLGPYAALLDEPGGLDLLAYMVRQGRFGG